MLGNLSSDQFGRTSANASERSANGQGQTSAGSGTTTVISVKGSTPNISTRSS